MIILLCMLYTHTYKTITCFLSSHVELHRTFVLYCAPMNFTFMFAVSMLNKMLGFCEAFGTTRAFPSDALFSDLHSPYSGFCVFRSNINHIACCSNRFFSNYSHTKPDERNDGLSEKNTLINRTFNYIHIFSDSITHMHAMPKGTTLPIAHASI